MSIELAAVMVVGDRCGNVRENTNPETKSERRTRDLRNLVDVLYEKNGLRVENNTNHTAHTNLRSKIFCIDK